LWTRWWTYEFHKRRGVSLQNDHLVAFEVLLRAVKHWSHGWLLRMDNGDKMHKGIRRKHRKADSETM
jgi:hypothetical protein